MTIRSIVEELHDTIKKLNGALEEGDRSKAKQVVMQIEKLMEYVDEWVEVFFDSIGGVS